MKRRVLKRRYGRAGASLPTEGDLNFMVRELGLDGAIRYSESLAARSGPLSPWYRDAYKRLVHRANAQLAGHNRRAGL